MRLDAAHHHHDPGQAYAHDLQAKSRILAWMFRSFIGSRCLLTLPPS